MHMVALRIAVTCTPEGGSHPNRWCATPTTKGRAGSQAHAGTSTSARSARLRTTPPAGAPPTRRQGKSQQNRRERVSVRTCGCWVDVATGFMYFTMTMIFVAQRAGACTARVSLILALDWAFRGHSPCRAASRGTGSDEVCVYTGLDTAGGM